MGNKLTEKTRQKMLRLRERDPVRYAEKMLAKGRRHAARKAALPEAVEKKKVLELRAAETARLRFEVEQRKAARVARSTELAAQKKKRAHERERKKSIPTKAAVIRAKKYAWIVWVITHWDEAQEHVAEMARRFHERRRIRRRNRRARERNAHGRLTQGLFDRLFKAQKGRCVACRANTPEGMHLDHIFPLAKGGQNEDANIQLLCPACNFAKRDRHPVDFMRSMGFLV